MITQYPPKGSSNADSMYVAFGDGMNIDPFGRLRVAEANTLFDSQQEYGLDTLRTWDICANGTLGNSRGQPNGSVSNGSNAVGPRDVNTRLTPIACSSTDTHYSVLQQRAYNRYIPGKGQLVFLTGVFASGSGATATLVRRTSTSGSVVDNSVAQSSWNIDKMDGTGVSGITLDFTKTQILVIQAQWLGVGEVIVAFDVNGILYPAHQFSHANSLTVPYTQAFNLPIRMDIRTSGSSTIARSGYFDNKNGIFLECTKATAGGTVYFNCCTVQSEGGVEYRGWPNCAPRTASSVGVTTRRPLLSIRPKATYKGVTNRAQVRELQFELRATTNDAFYEIVVGGTLTGSSFSPVGTLVTAGGFVTGVEYQILTVGTTDFTLIGASANTIGVVFTATGAGTGTGTAVEETSVCDFDTSATAISGGYSIVCGTVSAGAGSTSGRAATDADTRFPLVLSQIDALAATQTPITIVATSISGTSNIVTSYKWHESVV